MTQTIRVLSKLSNSGKLLAALVAFIIINPYAGGDVFAFLIILLFIAHKIFGEYAVLLFLVPRPFLDYWRDVVVFSYRDFNFNLNAGLSILLLLWSIYFFWTNRDYWKRIPRKLPWLFFVLWCAVTFLFSYDRSSTITETLKAANLFALFGIIYVMRLKYKEKFHKIFLWSLAAAALVPYLLALWQFAAGTGMSIDGISNRIYGTFAHPNILATFALLTIMVAANEIIKRKGAESGGQREKLYWLAAVSAFFLIFSYTRIAWIGFAIFLLFVGALHFRKLLLYGAAFIAIAFALFYPINAWLINQFNFNLQSIGLVARLTSRNREADSISWRADIANKVMPLWARRPLVGYGYGSFSKVWDEQRGVENIWDNTTEAHNDYLKVGFEAGLIGLGLFLLIFASLLYEQIKFGLKNHWKNIVFVASIVIYLVLSLSDNMLHHTPMIWWLWAVWGLWSAEYSQA